MPSCELPGWSRYPIRWGAFRRLSEARLSELEGRLWGYREQAEADSRQASGSAGRAVEDARAWHEGVAGWAISFCTDTDHDAEFAMLPIEHQRRLLADRLLMVPGLPPGAGERLAEALLALNSGQVNPLVAPSPTGRRNKRPYDRAGAELELLELRAFRIGTGEEAAAVDADLASAIGRSAKLLDRWQHVTLPAELGAEFVADAVREAHALGIDVAGGQPLTIDAKREVMDWRDPAYLRRLAEVIAHS